MRSILRFDTASAESGLLFQRFAENLTAALSSGPGLVDTLKCAQ